MKLKIHKTEEEVLIRRCRKQDGQAQKDVYDKYASKMLAICIRYIKEPDQAEDVMISAFMKVFDRIDQFKGEGSFEGWIRRIMVNESLTYIRRNKGMYLEVDIEYADREPDYNTLSTHLEAEDLLNLIQQLPIGYRTVFNLYAVEGYSHKEIAEQLEISENTSKSQLSRARTLLQKQLLNAEKTLQEKIK
ncbi:RNA polymerase sigma factor [Fulvivirga kasyanovii]|uniref:Sigma-70 family RNA polymerase sigma factor n=1 Tax=Fulvivirga kasyanovii TaxID=396812 RepID=A0ABW9RVS2_9BACT|nr:sigma-70 family RNA polymerase sigma factor [Fulvivirga kasyanovii]MTI27333.1 sigma-70 family RNA polymerase sigma factor [Fulvivirga kasyanovii]